MVYLANNQNTLFSVNQLHQSLKIPYKYLGKLMHKLNRAGLLEVVQGKQGGYRINLQRPPIYLYEVIGIVEGLENYNRCILGFEKCSDENPCTLHKYWLQQREGLREIIYNISLKQLEGLINMKY
jgi:Rrf2 family iron-sulfur cluster assembly transcriptional regulator